jgi:crossover junction endodeoxyribonuclease RuvC
MKSSPPPIPTGRTWIGIDPGFKGAIAVLSPTLSFVSVHDMPGKGGEDRRKEIDLPVLCEILRAAAGKPRPEVYLEWPQTRPDEAPESSKRFGVGMGNIEGICAALNLPLTRVASNLWKGALGLAGKDKADDAKDQAARLAEDMVRGLPAGCLRGPRGGVYDGRAEALLIAWWAATRSREGLTMLDVDTRLARVTFGNRRPRSRRSVL